MCQQHRRHFIGRAAIGGLLLTPLAAALSGCQKDGWPEGMTEIDDACLRQFVVAQPGTQEPAVFDQTVRDITAFLEYSAEPAALKRPALGVWALLFLAAFTFMAWLLKREYWRDVH